MVNPGEDLAYLRSAVIDLEQFILTKDIFWPSVRGGGDIQFSLGGLLLVTRRLQGETLSAEQSVELKANETAVESLYTHWQTHWQAKARDEVSMRLGLWRTFVEDYQRDPRAYFKTYPSQVRQRVIITLLQERLSQTAEEQTNLAEIDTTLRDHFSPGPFVWDAELKTAFPENEFWFLYGSLVDGGQKRSTHA